MLSSMRDDLTQVGGPGSRRALLAGSALAVAVFWAAPLAGVPAVGVALAATAAFAALLAVLLRQLAVAARRCSALGETLREAALGEARFKLLADHSADMIVEADRDLVRRYVSPSSGALLGYAPEELVGLPVAETVHPDDLPAFRDALDGLLDGSRDRFVVAQRYRRKDGSTIWAEGHLQALRDPETGRPSGFVGGLRDVTARRGAETAVRANEAFLRGVIDASPDCIKVLDLDGHVTFVSRNGLCLMEIGEASDLIGGDFAALWPPDRRPAVRSAVSAAASGASSRFRARCLAAKSRPLHLDVVIAPIAGADGTPERLIALSRDVTAGAEAEAELHRTRERYRLLAEHSSDVIVLRRPGLDGPVLYASPSCRHVMGYEPEALMAARPYELVHPDDRAELGLLLSELGQAEGRRLHAYRIRRADGEYIWVEAAFQLAEWDGEPMVVGALRDVTERQQRARDLAAAKEAAESARSSAEHASRTKSDFLAAMSHEIRTPLNSIIGFTDLMIDAGHLPEQAAAQAELIRISGAALLTVVNDILDFSKVEAGAVELEAIPFSPRALAEGCAAILRGYAGTKALDIEVEVGERLPAFLIGDEARLRQVLLNLLNNAVKFTSRGRVALRVMALDGPPADATVRFEVLDSGIGIPADKHHRLFERFSQVDSSVARRFGGSGLGLAICKRLVDLMGGTIGLSSREGIGSTFWFAVTLPRAAGPAAAPALDAAAEEPRSGRILVVEDIDINRRLAVALLEAAGHRVDVVGDGALAVKAVAETPYDLVLMDVQMPGMDGVTATRLIREAGGPHRGVPIVAMTANVFPEQIRSFREAGMDDHVGKPLHRAQLYAAVKRWTDPARPASGGADPAAASIGGSTPAGPPAFDEAAYAQLKSYLGPERLDDVLMRFAASLPTRFLIAEATPDALRSLNADAHVVLSVAGMTGFADLARACRSLEAAPGGSELHASCLAAVRAARDAAMAKLGALRAELAEEVDPPPAAAEDAA